MQPRVRGTRGQHNHRCVSSVARRGHHDLPRAAYHLTGDARKVHNGASQRHSCSLRALVDRGANGGIAGPNMRLLRWAGGTVDIHGIDNHRVSASKLGSFAAVIKTHLGERIAV